MKMRLKYSIFALMLWATAAACATSRGELISLHTSPRIVGGSLHLSFALQYKGTKPIEIYWGDLPWGSQGSINLKIHIQHQPGRVLKELGYIGDAPPLTIQLQPNHVYRGEINLSSMFQEIDELHKENNLTINWSYQLTAVDGYHFTRIEGCLLVPKSSN